MVHLSACSPHTRHMHSSRLHTILPTLPHRNRFVVRGYARRASEDCTLHSHGLLPPHPSFQVCNPENKQKRIYTGPLDFCAADGECYLPSWMMSQLKLSEGDLLAVATAQFPSGTFARFQPHSSDFLDIANHYYLLLKTLDHFAALTAGSTIRVTDGSRVHFLDVLEVKGKEGAPDASRGKAIDLTMVELTCDIRPPKDQEKAAKAKAAGAVEKRKGADDPEKATGTTEEAVNATSANDTTESSSATSPQPRPASKLSGSRAAARRGVKAAADAPPIAKFKTEGAKPSAGRKVGGVSTPTRSEDTAALGTSDEAEELTGTSGSQSQPALVRVAQQVVATLIAIIQRLLSMLFSPSGRGTAAIQVG
eukprot:scaffold10278_cov23-Tisochrysis_lutea.AAC.1